MFCLNDFFSHGAEWLADKVFETSNFFLSTAQVLVEEESIIYVQVKMLKVHTNFRSFDILQIIDISKQVLYYVATGQKKLLEVMYATVSHEMRNPMNSIICQNMLQ